MSVVFCSRHVRTAVLKPPTPHFHTPPPTLSYVQQPNMKAMDRYKEANERLQEKVRRHSFVVRAAFIHHGVGGTAAAAALCS